MKIRTQLINKSNLWFALVFTLLYLLFTEVFGIHKETVFPVLVTAFMALEVFLYFNPFTKRLSGMALFVRLTTSIIPSLILFFYL